MSKGAQHIANFVCSGNINGVENALRPYEKAHFEKGSQDYHSLRSALQACVFQLHRHRTHNCRVRRFLNLISPLSKSKDEEDTPGMLQTFLKKIKTLLVIGVPVNCKDKSGRAAIHLAVGYGHNFAFNSLLDLTTSVKDCLHSRLKGSTVEGEDYPLHHAVSDFNYYKVLEFLSERRAIGSSKRAITDGEEGPDTELNNVGLWKLLLQFGADLDITDGNGRTPLHLAVERNIYTVAQFLLSKGASVNKPTEKKGLTPIYLATQHCKSKPICELLLQSGADLSMTTEEGDSPLLLAVRLSRRDLVELFIKNSTDLNTPYHRGPLLFYAIQNRDRKMCELLLVSGADFQSPYGDSDESPLFLAVKRNLPDLVELFLEVGADPDQAAKDGTTPISSAVCEFQFNMRHVSRQEQSFRIIESLIEHGANVNIPNMDHKNALHVALEYYGCHEVVKLFLNNNGDVNSKTKNNITPVHIAAEYYDKRMFDLLLSFGADIHASDQDGRTPLHYAIDKSNHDIVEWLLDNRVDVNKRTVENIDSLYSAVVLGDEQMFKLLVKYNASIDLTMTKENKTILHRAVDKGCSQIVEHILQNCDVVKENFDGLLRTAVLKSKSDSRSIVKLLVNHGFNFDTNYLHDEELILGIIKNGYVEFFDSMLQQGLDMNIPVEMGDDCLLNTLLHVAVRSRQKSIVELLLTRGVSVNVFDVFRKTPLMLAVELANSPDSEIEEIVQLLCRWGASVDCRDKRETTPLLAAVLKGNLQIVNILLKYGANPNCADVDDVTPLHTVIKNKKIDFFGPFVQGCLDISITDDCTQVFDLLKNETGDHFWYRDIIMKDQVMWTKFNQLMKEYVIKMKIANLRLKEPVLKWLPPVTASDLSEMAEKCESEISAMKAEIVGDATFTFYDILSNDSVELGASWKYESCREILNSASWREKYPTYQGMIRAKLKIVEKETQCRSEPEPHSYCNIS